MAIYGHRIATQSIPAGTARVRFYGGNSSRVALIVSSVTATVIRLGDKSGSDNGSVFVFVRTLDGYELPFRNYGPAIQGEIWASHTDGGSVVVNITEVYFITRCE